MHKRVVTEQEVSQFLAEQLSARPSKLSMAAQLAKDLGVDGDDAVELMEAYSKRFDVNLASYDHSKYFGPEAGFNLFNLLFPWWWKRIRSLKPITVEHLLRCANEGVWRDI